MATIELMLKDYRLTTAEIFYHLPDHPSLLQTFIWQQLDLAPRFPELRRFLAFWENKIEGKLHSVQVDHCTVIAPPRFQLGKGEFVIH